MRILVPSIVDPETFRGGAGTATRGLLGLLAGPPLSAELEVLPSCTPDGRLRHGMRQARSLLAAALGSLPSKAIFQRAGGYGRRLRRRLARRDYDLVLVNGCDLLWALDAVPPGVPVLVCAHNLEYELYERQLASMRMPRWLRPLIEVDVRALRRFELDGLRRATGTLFLSSTEAARVRARLGPRAPLVVPPVFDEPPHPKAKRRAGEPVDVGFFANFDWWPNRDAVRWFLDEIHPACHHEIRLHLFGRGSERIPGGGAGVTRHGAVAHPFTVWDACDIMICPVRAGGGVNVKLAEALYNGMPVIATPWAVDGLPVDAGPALAVADGARAWIDILAGPTLAALASATVPREHVDVFRADRHRDAVAAYVADVAAEAA